MTQYKILNETYEIIDSLSNITLADSFVLNKIGGGHGEAKLYVGNENKELLNFFDDFSNESMNGFFIKDDFLKFLADAKQEYKNPGQKYRDISEFPKKFDLLKNKFEGISDNILKFDFYKSKIQPPRIYINSSEKNYNLMRDVGLPNISYVSIMKLKNSTNNILYYFKVFIDYDPDIIGYLKQEESRQEEEIFESVISEKKKTTLIAARVGQGEYREKLLSECMYCPFTEVNDERVLIASHIKPWSKSDEKEKIDPKNGFIFTPTFDKLFDRGFISFTNEKKLKVSPWLSPLNQKKLGIIDGKNISLLPLDDVRKKYLEYHREFIFKK